MFVDTPTPGDQIVVKLNISVPYMSCECKLRVIAEGIKFVNIHVCFDILTINYKETSGILK